MPGRRASGAYHAASLLSATVLSRLIAFLSIPILVGALSTTQYGTLGLIQSAIPLAVPILTLGIAQIVVIAYNIRDSSAGRGTPLQTVFTFAFLVAVVVVPVVAWCVRTAYPGLDVGLLLAASAVGSLSIIRVLLDGLGQAGRRVEQVAVSRIAREAGLLLTLMLVVALFELDLRAALVCYALAELYSVLVLLRPVSFVISLIALRSLRRIRDLLAVSVPLVPHALSIATITYVDRWFIGWKLGMHDVAVYTLAGQLAGVLASVYSALNEAVVVRYQAAMGDGGIESLRETHWRLVWWYPIVAISGAALIMAAGWLYLRLMAPADYYAGVAPMGLILFGLVLHSMYLPFANVLFAMRRTYVPAIGSTAAAVLNVAANALLVPRIGILGAAVATVLAYGCLLAVVVTQAWRLAGVNMRLSDLRSTSADGQALALELARRFVRYTRPRP